MVEISNKGKKMKNIPRNQFLITTKKCPVDAEMFDESDLLKIASERNLNLSERV